MTMRATIERSPAQSTNERGGPSRPLYAELSGQVRSTGELALDTVSRRIEFISPMSGPSGTVVTLETGGLPAITPVRIGIGAARAGFEEIGQLMTTETGELTTTVEVPAWAERDRTHIFIVFDFYFRPLALSAPFHVTGSDGTVLRAGRLTSEGIECPALRTDDGELYTLSGDTSAFEVGDEVIVEGTIAEASTCMQGTTIGVVGIRAG